MQLNPHDQDLPRAQALPQQQEPEENKEAAERGLMRTPEASKSTSLSHDEQVIDSDQKIAAANKAANLYQASETLKALTAEATQEISPTP